MSQYREVVELLPCYLGLVAQRGRGDGPLQIQFQLKGTATLTRGTGPYPFLLVLICRPFVMTSTVRVDARGAQGAWNGGGREGRLYDATPSVCPRALGHEDHPSG